MDLVLTSTDEIESVLKRWRHRTLNTLLAVATLAAFPALLVAVIAWLDKDVLFGPLFFGAVYVLLLALAVLRRVDQRLRAWILLIITYLASAFALGSTGLVGFGRLALALVPVIAFIVISPRAGWIATVLSFVVYFVIGFMVSQGLWVSPIDVADTPQNASVWVVSGVSLLLLLIAAMIVMDRFYRLLLDTLRAERKASAELAQAYNSTLEGWARALELFDRETESHSLRVTDMTLRLARSMGIKPSELIDVYRGALLHDIGKMGVPDSVLLKPGPLTCEEQETMRKHPVYALQLLSPIAFLHRALDIPYSHHEKWDGTGYPCGLKGEEIPLAARIFSVVDVWDALTSARPYHEAWPFEKAREYILERAGRDFDPRVVTMFLNLALR